MRLTNAHRSQIVTELTKDYLKKELETVRHRMENLAIDVYHHILGDNCKRIKRLPEDWFPSRSYVRVKIAGSYQSLSFSNQANPKRVRLPMPHYLIRDVTLIAGSHELSKRYTRLNAEVVKIQLDQASLANDIRSALDERTTVATLIKEWPEIEPTVRNMTRLRPPGVVTTAATTNLKAMNSLIGIKNVTS